MIISSISDFSLQYDEQLSLLRVDWASGNDIRNLRTSIEKLLQMDRKLGVRNMLINMNSFPDISVYDQVWLSANWMPGIIKMPLERVVVVNHRRRVHNQLAIDSLLSMALPLIKFDIQFFPQPAPGLAWLTDYSDRLPVLQAEWEAVHGPSLNPHGVAEPEARYHSGTL